MKNIVARNGSEVTEAEDPLYAPAFMLNNKNQFTYLLVNPYTNVSDLSMDWPVQLPPHETPPQINSQTFNCELIESKAAAQGLKVITSLNEKSLLSMK